MTSFCALYQDDSIWRTGNDVMLPMAISKRHLSLLVGLHNKDVAHNINQDICFLIKAIFNLDDNALLGAILCSNVL